MDAITKIRGEVKALLNQCCIDDALINAVDNIFTSNTQVPVSPHVINLPPQSCITEVSIAKFHKLLPEAIPWHGNNVYGFSINSAPGRVYRWITVFFNNGMPPSSFLLESPTGILSVHIRKAIIAGGMYGIPPNSPLGRVYSHESLGIRQIGVSNNIRGKLAILTANYNVPTPSGYILMPAGIIR